MNDTLEQKITKAFDAEMNGKTIDTIVKINVTHNDNTISFMAQGGKKQPSFAQQKAGKCRCIYLWTMLVKNGKLYTSSSYVNQKGNLVATGDMVATNSDKKLWISHGLTADDFVVL